ncbi:barstar family protein [Enterobacteriaceae bacterium LUAb1]
MTEYWFDFRRISDIADFYRACRQQWQLPEWFGDNLDALWDVLLSGELPLPVTLHITHLCSQKRAGAFEDLISLLREAEAELNGDLIIKMN